MARNGRSEYILEVGSVSPSDRLGVELKERDRSRESLGCPG